MSRKSALNATKTLSDYACSFVLKLAGVDFDGNEICKRGRENTADAEAYVGDQRVVQAPSLALHYGLDE